MAIERWDPFREAISLRDAMNSLLQESFVRPGGMGAQNGYSALPLDVCENENEFVVKAALPGVKPEDVQITVHGDTLTIRGESKAEEEKKGEQWHLRERRFGAFQRSVSLATPVNSEKAQAHYEHGVLTLRLPKSEAAKPRQIKIGGNAQGQVAQEKWYVVLRAPSVESIEMKLVVFLTSEVPAIARNSVLMFRLRRAPQGAQTNAASCTSSLVCQSSASGPVMVWLAKTVCD